MCPTKIHKNYDTHKHLLQNVYHNLKTDIMSGLSWFFRICTGFVTIVLFIIRWFCRIVSIRLINVGFISLCFIGASVIYICFYLRICVRGNLYSRVCIDFHISFISVMYRICININFISFYPYFIWFVVPPFFVIKPISSMTIDIITFITM